jgi:hypothetical protein
MITRKRHVTMLLALTLALLGVASRASTPDTSRGRPASDFLTRPSLSNLGADPVSTPATTEIARLPMAAQASISQALGRDHGAYHAVADDGDIRAENVRHDLTARFSAAGVEVSSENERLTLALRAYGYGEALRPVVGAEPQAEANRVVYRRGPLDEWYVNGPSGLEQGFTLQTPPEGLREGPLTLSLTIGGTLDPQLDAYANGLNFAPSSVRYHGLFAMDADGRDLPAWLELDGRTLALRVDDNGARYPLTIDPFVQQAELTASDGAANDHFGTAVAVSGDTALVGAAGDDVGANEDQGSAYVFTRAGLVWTQQAKLTASDGAAFDGFGISVALSGDTALVGAGGVDVGANLDQGAAYVFTRTGTVWTQQAKLTASDGASNDLFGRDGGVALDGDTALVGARNDDVGTKADQGSAYVFTRAGAVWTQQAQLIASDGAAGDEFGVNLAVSGDTALVGARRDDVGGKMNQGSAYVFTRAGAVWTQQAHLTASDGAAHDGFGDSVALSGDTALVGSPFNEVDGKTLQGSAYVFTRTGTAWTEQAQLTAADGAADDRFSQDTGVALSGDTALVGAWGDDVGANVNQGSAYVFTRAGAVWTQQAKLTASDGAAFDEFGGTVALSGDTALVGGINHDVGENVNQGAAYVWPGVAPPATLTLDPPAATNPVNSPHCVTATVEDAAGNRVPEVTVRFTVIGAVNTSGPATTNAQGQASFCYNGPALPGADAITAYADANNDNTQDVSEPSGAAAKTWFVPLPTLQDQCKNGGWKTFGVFKNQGDCVSFVSTGGKNPPANLP